MEVDSITLGEIKNSILSSDPLNSYDYKLYTDPLR